MYGNSERACALTRRQVFDWTTHGLAGAALIGLFQSDQARARDQHVSDTPLGIHHVPKAKRAIHFCLCGGLSHIDSFDYKPALAAMHGKSLSSQESPEVFFGKVGLLRQNDWLFKQRGKSGKWVSELFPHIATVVDELTFIHSMVADSSSHTPATLNENSGFRLNGFPTLGSWLSYGLGSESEELPAYIVLPDGRGLPASGTNNWTSGFLPARHQGVALQTGDRPVADLFPARATTAAAEVASQSLLRELNERDAARWLGEEELLTRMRSYELAAKMQSAIPRVSNFADESAHTLGSYGIEHADTNDFGTRLLLARRLLESGVRFVQVFSGGDFSSPRINWDAHENVIQNHSQEAVRIDQPIAAFIRDLKQRGMLADTLLLFTSEFGRTPFTQSASDVVGTGRDHNQTGFTVWLAGAGLRPGMAFGATDEIGWKSVENPVSWPDFHATVLHLLGIDHERLTYYHNGIQRRLTNVHGRVLREILA